MNVTNTLSTHRGNNGVDHIPAAAAPTGGLDHSNPSDVVSTTLTPADIVNTCIKSLDTICQTKLTAGDMMQNAEDTDASTNASPSLLMRQKVMQCIIDEVEKFSAAWERINEVLLEIIDDKGKLNPGKMDGWINHISGRAIVGPREVETTNTLNAS